MSGYVKDIDFYGTDFVFYGTQSECYGTFTKLRLEVENTGQIIKNTGHFTKSITRILQKGAERLLNYQKQASRFPIKESSSNPKFVIFSQDGFGQDTIHNLRKPR